MKATRLSTPIAKHLRGIHTWRTAGVLVKTHFRHHMKGRAYGREACRDAWLWYVDGWADGESCSSEGQL